MGMSITSQKKKNRNKSSAVNTPTTPAITHNTLNWKNPVRSLVSVHDDTTATAPKNSVNAVSMSERPSMLRMTWMPKRGIHSMYWFA